MLLFELNLTLKRLFCFTHKTLGYRYCLNANKLDLFMFTSVVLYERSMNDLHQLTEVRIIWRQLQGLVSLNATSLFLFPSFLNVLRLAVIFKAFVAATNFAACMHVCKYSCFIRLYSWQLMSTKKLRGVLITQSVLINTIQ